MEWNRSETLALATHGCAYCHGLGLRPEQKGDSSTPCNCVLRAIFKACYSKFRFCASKGKYLSKVTLELSSGVERRATWGRKDEEYMADFCLVTKRTLTAEEYRIFNYHYLLGADWKLCCRKLKMDRGNFFHAIYRIQQKLGKTFRELEPYALYPLSDYFRSLAPGAEVKNRKVVPIRPATPKLSSRVPLRRTA